MRRIAGISRLEKIRNDNIRQSLGIHTTLLDKAAQRNPNKKTLMVWASIETRVCSLHNLHSLHNPTPGTTLKIRRKRKQMKVNNMMDNEDLVPVLLTLIQ